MFATKHLTNVHFRLFLDFFPTALVDLSIDSVILLCHDGSASSWKVLAMTQGKKIEYWKSHSSLFQHVTWRSSKTGGFFNPKDLG